MVGHGGSSAGSYLATPTSHIPSHCAVFILFKPASSASIVVTSILRVNHCSLHNLGSSKIHVPTNILAVAERNPVFTFLEGFSRAMNKIIS